MEELSSFDINFWRSKSWELLTTVRKTIPLIQCLTNFVSMDLMANIVLAAGASPAMVHCLQEIADFTPNINGLCINVGTLSPDWLPSMKAAASLANQLGKPWVLDPVAVSVSDFRMKACIELIELGPTVIRGNASEIIALSKSSRESNKGADSSFGSMEAIEAAKSLAQATKSIVAVTGAVDIITDGKQVLGACNGVSLLQHITATGCAVTALIATFVSVDPTHAFEATACALSIFGVASEVGMSMSKGPGSLRMSLIDALHCLDKDTVFSHVKINPIH